VSERQLAAARLEEELATLGAHVNAATARWLELVRSFLRQGALADADAGRWLAFRCGITTREAREYLRVAEALDELPAICGAFARGELTFTKVRSLVRVATPTSEEGLLELAEMLTASQLERALRAFQRLAAEDARETHELEYVDYHFAEDGSLYLRARLAAEDGTLVVRALEAARERIRQRRREARAGAADATGETAALEPSRAPGVEALVDVARTALSSSEHGRPRRAALVVHVDAAALTADGPGRSELEGGPVIAPETARRLGCDAQLATSVERDGLPVSVGRARRSVPAGLRRLLEARDQGCCRWPGCETRVHLEAHHRRHWAHGGETSLDNLVLLCWRHHRLVHEGGYTIEDDAEGRLRFRNRHGVLCPTVPRPPPVSNVDELVAQNERLGLALDARTSRNGHGDRLDLEYAVAALEHVLA